MRELRETLRLKAAGVRFDYYLMDAFWYAPDGGYRRWRSESWPEGPEAWLAACALHRLKDQQGGMGVGCVKKPLLRT